MHTTYHLGISFPHDIILSLLLILAFLNSVSALVTLRVSLRGCFEARVAGKRTTVTNRIQIPYYRITTSAITSSAGTTRIALHHYENHCAYVYIYICVCVYVSVSVHVSSFIQMPITV